MMRVVMIIDTLDSGGKERQFVELVKGLATSRQVQCELIILSETIHYTELLELGIPVHTLIRRTKRDFRVFIKLFQLIKELKPDILHSWSSMCSIYILPAVLIQRISFVNGFLRNAPPLLHQSRKEWLRSKITFPFSNAVVANSQAGLRAYDAPKGKSFCIYNGFDFNRLQQLRDPHEILDIYGITTELVVGMVGSFTANKDYQTFLQAAHQVLSKRRDVTFLAIGEGDNRDKCMQSVAESDRDLIRFLGRIKDVESLMQIFSIGILCTNAKVHGEGISNSIMEYMALGKAVVATDCGGNNELIINEETGFLIQHGNAEELTERIHYLLDHQNHAKRMGMSARNRLEANFNLERMTNDYLKLYTGVSGEILVN